MISSNKEVLEFFSIFLNFSLDKSGKRLILYGEKGAELRHIEIDSTVSAGCHIVKDRKNNDEVSEYMYPDKEVLGFFSIFLNFSLDKSGKRPIL